MRKVVFIICFLFEIPFLMQAMPADTIFREMKDTITFKKKLAETSKNLTTIEADFSQWKNMNMLKTPAVSDGYFCYRNGTQIRWEYKQPFSYLFIINNGKLTVKDDSHTSSFDLTSNKAFVEINNKLTAIMDGSILNKRADFRIKFYENERQYLLELTPVSGGMESYYKTVSVYFDRFDFSVSTLILLEKNGDYTEIVFKNKKINQPLPDEKFIVR